MVSPNDSALLACPHGQLVLLAPFACTNLRWGIGILPQQTGVYVPRCLNQVNRSMTGTLSHWTKTRDRRRRRRPPGFGSKTGGLLEYPLSVRFAQSAGHRGGGQPITRRGHQRRLRPVLQSRFREMSSRCYRPWRVGPGSWLHAVTSIWPSRFRLPRPGGPHGGATGRWPGAACAGRTSAA